MLQPIFDRETRSFDYQSTTYCRDRSLNVKNTKHIITRCDGFVGQCESDYSINTMPFIAVDDEDEAAVVLYTRFMTSDCDKSTCDLYFPEIDTETIHVEHTGTTITDLKIGLMGNKEIKMFIDNMKRTIEYLESFEDFNQNKTNRTSYISETNTL